MLLCGLFMVIQWLLALPPQSEKVAHLCMASLSLSLGAPAFSPFKFAKLAVDVSISSLFVALQ